MAYWIFKCDPKRYRLADRVADARPEITWLVTRYKNVIVPGDVVFLMETGPRRCIRAVMRVDTKPAEMGEMEAEQAHWADRDTETKCRVLGTITHRTEMAVDDLTSVAGLENLSILRGFQQGTNFKVSDKEGEILMSLVERVAP